MAQNPPSFSTWSPSSEAENLSYKFGNSSVDVKVGSAVSMDMDQLAWQQLERVSILHYPTRVQIQRPDMLGFVDSRYGSGQVLEFQSGYNDVSNSILNDGFPEVTPLGRTNSSVINRTSNSTRSLPEAVLPDLDHRVEEAVEARRGRRRRASENGTPEGWVASKNLISERMRREKLQKGLITLRELVPMFNMKMDKISILTDAISHLQDLKRKVEMLESTYSNDEDRVIDLKGLEVAKSSCTDLGTRDGTEMDDENRKDSSLDASFCSELFDDSVVRCNYETSPSSRDWNLHQIQLDVTKLEHGVYKLDLICMQESGVLVQLSQAIEAFVIEVVHTSIVVITSSKVTCTFVVKMSSWNDMTLEDITVDIKMLLGKSDLQIS